MSNYNCGIYRIRNLVNDKCIYGSSQNIKKRWKQHRSNLINQRHENIIVQRAWNKYGEDNFVFEKIEKCSIEDLKIVEQKYIDGNNGGYNIAPAQGGDMLSSHPNRKEIIERRTETQRKTVAQMSDEERKEKWGRIGENNPNWRNGGVSKKLCPKCGNIEIAATNNQCHNCRDRNGINNPFFNKKHSKETIEKIKIANRGKKMSEEAKLKISGENSVRFQGYYYTPWGKFPSSSQAEDAHSYLKSNTINTWCKEPDKKIIRIGKSKFLKEIGETCVGKTYREIGFWFEPK